jgi:hypothetical protein
MIFRASAAIPTSHSHANPALHSLPPQWCHDEKDDDKAGGNICGNNADVLTAYTQQGGAATGGTVYRGQEFADTAMAGAYIFADYMQQAVMVSGLQT